MNGADMMRDYNRSAAAAAAAVAAAAVARIITR